MAVSTQTAQEDRRQTALRYIDGIARSDLPDRLFAPDFSGWSGMSGDIAGPEIRQRALMIGELFPDGLAFEIFETVAEGDIVAVRASSHGIMFDGTDYRNDYHFQFLFDEQGRILKVREFMNVKVAAELIRPAMLRLKGDPGRDPVGEQALRRAELNARRRQLPGPDGDASDRRRCR